MHDGGVRCGTFMKIILSYGGCPDATIVGLEDMYKTRSPFFIKHTDLHLPISL